MFKLISGDFAGESFKAVSKICPHGKLRIIFSSTFTDTPYCPIEEIYR